MRTTSFLRPGTRAEAVAALRDERGQVSDEIEALISARVRSLRSASATTPPDTSPGTTANAFAPPPICDACGPCSEADALYCSRCGRRLASRPSCDGCKAELSPDSRYCDRCGRQVAPRSS
jgi:predicted amidophosphoribosyltransferase